MNLPMASPNENMKIESSINPMPARRAERSAAAVEILASRVMNELRGYVVFFVMAGLVPAIHAFLVTLF